MILVLTIIVEEVNMASVVCPDLCCFDEGVGDSKKQRRYKLQCHTRQGGIKAVSELKPPRNIICLRANGKAIYDGDEATQVGSQFEVGAAKT